MGQKKMISCYKLAGADLNTVNMSRQTALHAAVETGQFKVVQFLIEHHIDTTRKDIFGRTPFHMSCKYGRLNTTKFILNSSANQG